jgi:hypothetical protein
MPSGRGVPRALGLIIESGGSRLVGSCLISRLLDALDEPRSPKRAAQSAHSAIQVKGWGITILPSKSLGNLIE